MNDTLIDLEKFVEKIVASKLAKLDAEYNGDFASYRDEFKAFVYDIHNAVEDAIYDAQVQ